MSESSVLALALCAAPPVLRIGELIEVLQEDGWTVRLTATPTTATWIIGKRWPGRRNSSAGGMAMPGGSEPHPPATAMSMVPATFNVINKWASKVNDTLTPGILNEVLGAGLPAYAFSNGKAQLAAHPSYRRHLGLLIQADVRVMPLPAELDWHVVTVQLASPPQTVLSPGESPPGASE